MIKLIYENWPVFSCGIAVGACIGATIMVVVNSLFRGTMCEDCDFIVRGDESE